MSAPVPSIGRMVHYRSFGTPGGEYMPACRAAIITEVHSDTVVSLSVHNPTGLFFVQQVALHASAGGTWHWPKHL